MKKHPLLLALSAAAALAVAYPAFAQTVLGTIPAGNNPRAVTINSVTNRIYVANDLGNNVTILNGANNTTVTLPVGSRPQFIAANPWTNRIYVSNVGGSSISVIDGATTSVMATLASGGSGAAAINPVTNKAYIARFGLGDEVVIVNGATNNHFAMGYDSYEPVSVAVNPVTNKLYVASKTSGEVAAIPLVPEVEHPVIVKVRVGSRPIAVTVNPVTNRIYAITENAFSPIVVIDGSSDTPTALIPTAGHAVGPRAVAVNAVTNKVYAAFDSEVIVIDGASNSFTYIPASNPRALGVNAITNKIYVPNSDGSLLVINGDDNTTTSLAIPAGANSIAVNPATNRAYVVGDAGITVIAGSATDTAHANPITTTITPVPGNKSGQNVTFTLNASTTFAPNAPPIRKVYYQLDGQAIWGQGAWMEASGSGPYAASFSALASGTHTLRAFAVDGQDAPAGVTGPQNAPLIGNIATYTFTVAGNPYDFNADAKADILWRNTSNGATYVWYMNGPAFVSDAFVGGVDPAWKIDGVADFNRDGQLDLVWRNAASGETVLWYMNGPNFISGAPLFSLPPEWVIQGVADFNGDGKPDFLIRNATSGLAFVWFFNDATPVGDQYLFSIDPAWKVEAVADLNADGQPDLLFRNMNSGLAFTWYTQYSGTLSLAGSSAPMFGIDPAWEVAELADWNGDGNPDLLFRNRNTGVVFVWYLTGTTLAASAYVTQVDPSWEIVPRR